MPKYRIISYRYDTDREFTHFNATNDVEAKKKFEREFKNNKNFSWDHLDLYRIIQEEKLSARLDYKD